MLYRMGSQVFLCFWRVCLANIFGYIDVMSLVADAIVARFATPVCYCVLTLSYWMNYVWPVSTSLVVSRIGGRLFGVILLSVRAIGAAVHPSCDYARTPTESEDASVFATTISILSTSLGICFSLHDGDTSFHIFLFGFDFYNIADIEIIWVIFYWLSVTYDIASHLFTVL